MHNSNQNATSKVWRERERGGERKPAVRGTDSPQPNSSLFLLLPGSHIWLNFLMFFLFLAFLFYCLAHFHSSYLKWNCLTPCWSVLPVVSRFLTSSETFLSPVSCVGCRAVHSASKPWHRYLQNRAGKEESIELIFFRKVPLGKTSLINVVST